MRFNENLKYLRKQANLTQEQLAEELNVSRQDITKWESGQSMPDIEKIKDIICIIVIDVIFSIINYKKLAKKIKEFNENK